MADNLGCFSYFLGVILVVAYWKWIFIFIAIYGFCYFCYEHIYKFVNIQNQLNDAEKNISALYPIFQKIDVLKSLPNISSDNLELLLKLENLLKSKDYSNSLDSTISDFLDEILIKIPQILRLTALINNLSNESRINYVPSLTTKNINLLQLIKIIKEVNNEKKFAFLLNLFFRIIAALFFLIILIVLFEI